MNGVKIFLTHFVDPKSWAPRTREDVIIPHPDVVEEWAAILVGDYANCRTDVRTQLVKERVS